jgi:hypothetical protein
LVVSARLAHLERDAQAGVHNQQCGGAGGLLAAVAGPPTGSKRRRWLDHYESVPLSVSASGGICPIQPLRCDAIGSGRCSYSGGFVAARSCCAAPPAYSDGVVTSAAQSRSKVVGVARVISARRCNSVAEVAAARSVTWAH